MGIVAGMTISRRRKLTFALAAIAGSTLAIFSALLAIDVYLHTKYQTSAGFNVWGYRGPAAGRKQKTEYRVVMVGGSSAYGYGVTWDQAIPAQLEQYLAKAAPAGRTFKVINLGYNNEGAYSFAVTLKDYDYLDYDLACLYEGYNDLIGDPLRPNVSVFRHDSPVFRLTGYLPIFPIVFKEKAASLLAGGDPGALYRSESKTVFRPGAAETVAAGALRTVGEMGQSLERQLGRVSVEPRWRIDAPDATGCKHPWGQYCRSVANAISAALASNRQVLFITQPYKPEPSLRVRHIEQQREVAAMIARDFGGNPRVRYVNLGDTVDLNDSALSFDHMHLTADGNVRIAQQLVAPVADMASRQGSAASAHR
jgi:hypothetical protein